METIRVLVVDDHALFRRGITSVLATQGNLTVVGEATDGLEAIEKAQALTPDVILMDLNMPRCSGLEATQALQARMPEANILVLTVSDNEADLFAAMKFGAKGYILKNTEPDELVQAILHIAQGGVIISPLMAAKLLSEFRETGAQEVAAPPGETEAELSPREDEVLRLVAQGATNKQIAETLFISENTVKTHLRNIMEKLHLANRSQAAAYAVKKGLVPKE
ncbi:MAG TPA: response regulator transcription factor [Dehalococcoidia bacterium]|jgi:DNA-binding NarL/FixJ family response regulator|nr:response regulator transcription factor [Dehalococcoidia bacterium]